MGPPGALLRKAQKIKKINSKKISYIFSRKSFSYILGNGTL